MIIQNQQELFSNDIPKKPHDFPLRENKTRNLLSRTLQTKDFQQKDFLPKENSTASLFKLRKRTLENLSTTSTPNILLPKLNGVRKISEQPVDRKLKWQISFE